MINFNSPPHDQSWKCCRTKRKVSAVEGPWQGEWGMEMERQGFSEVLLSWGLTREGEERGAELAQPRRRLPKVFTRYRSQCAATDWREECECEVECSDCFLRIFSRLMFIIVLIYGMASVEKLPVVSFSRKFALNYAPKVYNYNLFRSLLMSETASDHSM